MTHYASWRLDEQRAQLAFGPFQFQLAIDSPSRGLHDITLDGTPLPTVNLLGVQFAEQSVAAPVVADNYIRGRDLVVTYAPAFERPVRLQIYWRAAEAIDYLAAVDVQVSVQTSLLAAWPAVTVRSHWPATAALRVSADGQVRELRAHQRTTIESAAGCWMWRLPALGITYCQMMHPNDAQRDEFRVDASEVHLDHYLFPDSLEKGVIRRARARGAFVRIEDDAEQVSELYRQFLVAPLPLTT